MSKTHLLAAVALLAFGGCFADVNLGDRSEADPVDAGDVCDPAANEVCPCDDPTDCPPTYECVIGSNATPGTCVPPANNAGSR